MSGRASQARNAPGDAGHARAAPSRQTRIAGDTDSGRPAGRAVSTILSAAAECFRENGYAATSIDDVARALGATKGMIYHHFRSKTDLFFAVYRRGMELNFEASQPPYESDRPPVERLTRMAHAHAVAMMHHQAFQRVLGQGVAMHQQGSTTAAQRDTLSELIDLRDRYETLYRNAIEAAAEEAGLALRDASLATKSFLAVLNSSVYWYSPRRDDELEEQHAIAAQLVTFAMQGLGLHAPDHDEPTEGEDDE